MYPPWPSVIGTVGTNSIPGLEVKKLSNTKVNWIPWVTELPSILSPALGSFLTPTVYK